MSQGVNPVRSKSPMAIADARAHRTSNGVKIDLLHGLRRKKKEKNKFLYPVGFIICALLLGGTLLFFSSKLFFASRTDNFSREQSFWSGLKHLVLSPERDLGNRAGDRLNILFLGIGGAGHDGPDLTDTIILVSVDKDNKKAALLTIPRDLVVNMPPFGRRKINSANSLQELKEPGTGGEFVSRLISRIFDIPVHYYIRIDFQGIVKLTDILGGLNIYVDRSFIDPLYPVENANLPQSQKQKEIAERESIALSSSPVGASEDSGVYISAPLTQTVSFEQGEQIMDGQTVLKYIRSRHGNNGEGSDFARSRRQQKALLALKNKALSLESILNPKKIKDIIQTLSSRIKTNLKTWEIIKLANLSQELEDENIILKSLKSGPQEPLYEIERDDAYILLPKKDDWSDLRYIAKNIFDREEELNFGGANGASPETTVMVLNGTNITGLAGKIAETLRQFNYQISYTGNAPRRDYEKTVIYNLDNSISESRKKEAIVELRKIFGANVASNLPVWFGSLLLLDEPRPDFVIIVGVNK